LTTHTPHPAETPLRYEWVVFAETWQVFAVIVGTFFFGVFITVWVGLENLPVAVSVGSNYISEILLAGWFYSVGMNLHHVRPEGPAMSTRFFAFNLSYFLLYTAVLVVFTATMFDKPIVMLTPHNILYLLPFHVYAIVAACSIVSFVARALVSAELHQPAAFHLASGTFLLLFFFPFGIWTIQPRIQRIFRDRVVHEDNLAGDLVDT
jgi:hypothetical protein